MLNLSVGTLEFGTVAGDTRLARNEGGVIVGVALQPGAGQKSQVIDDGIGGVLVVETLEDDLLGQLRVRNAVCQVSQQSNGLVHHVLEEHSIVAADVEKVLVQARDAGDFAKDLILVAIVGEMLKVGEPDGCGRNSRVSYRGVLRRGRITKAGARTRVGNAG